MAGPILNFQKFLLFFIIFLVSIKFKSLGLNIGSKSFIDELFPPPSPRLIKNAPLKQRPIISLRSIFSLDICTIKIPQDAPQDLRGYVQTQMTETDDR